VNCGVGGAAKQLQRALNELAGGAVVNIDGVVGPATLAAIGRVEWQALAKKYIDVRTAYYNGLVAKNSSQGVFLEGWLNRLNRLRAEVELDG
jgi:lysozyme family protein